MAKFPSQRKLHYKLEGIDDQTMTSLGHLNLPKDLSILNRRGYASTSRKGVPLIFRCKVDFYIQNHLGHLFDDDGTALASAYNADMQATLKFTGAQNNWVFKNAAVKWQAAREHMFRKAGIKKGLRGAYSHEIRYNLDGASDAWLAPIDGDGNALTGGTWDVTSIVTEDDASIQLKLVGDAVSEDTDVSTSIQQIAYSYLASRANLREDTNDEAEEVGDRSLLESMLADATLTDSIREVLSGKMEDEQDNVPYDHFAIGDTDHDVTESVELGRAIAGMGSAFGSMIVDIPFGLADCRGTIMQHATQTDEPDGFMAVEVLDIFEMQG